MGRTLHTLGLIGVLSTGLAGCGSETEASPRKVGEYKGYTAIIETTPKSRRLYLGLDLDGGNSGSYDYAHPFPTGPSSSFWILADDFQSDDDNRFDQIKLINVPVGHPIVELASIPELGKVYDHVDKTGRVVK